MGRSRFALRVLLVAVLWLIPAYTHAASLTLAWDPDSGASGFIVSYGTRSGVYTNSVDAGNVIQKQVDGLANATMYYFIVQAYDSLGNRSLPSFEVSGMTSGTASVGPAILCPSPVGVSANGSPVAVTFSASVTGGTAPVNTVCSPASGSLFSVGSSPLTCTATDAQNLSASCSSWVVVSAGSSAPNPNPNPPQPPTPPTPATAPLAIICPAPSGMSMNGSPVQLNFSATTSGGVSPISTTCTPASGSLFPVGTTPFTCTAVDATSARMSCTSNAIVTANLAPPPTLPPVSVTCPLIPPVVSHSGNAVKVIFAPPTVTGGVAPVTTVCVPQSGSTFGLGATAVNCSVYDAKEQTDSCVATVIVTSDKATPVSLPTGTPIEFDSPVVNLLGKCPASTFTATSDTGSYTVTTSSITNYSKGSCGSLANGRNIHVQGLQQTDGSVVATAISFLK